MLAELLEATPDEIVITTWPHRIVRHHLRTVPTPREFQTDFAPRLLEVERTKSAMRARYKTAADTLHAKQQAAIGRLRLAGAPAPDICGLAAVHYELVVAQMLDFWRAYEAYNVEMLPEDPAYTGVRTAIAEAASEDLWTLTGASNTQFRILESYIAGEAAASDIARFHLNVSTGGTTPTEGTENKLNSRSPSATALFRTEWSTEPTAGSATIVHAFNAFGGADRWVPQPGAEMYSVNAEQISCRNDEAAAAPTCSVHVIWEEL